MAYSYPACKNLLVDGPQSYVDKIKPLLDNINGVAFGQMLYGFIAKNGDKTLTIYSDGSKDINNIATAMNNTRANTDLFMKQATALAQARHISLERAADIITPDFNAKTLAGAFAKGEPVKSSAPPPRKVVAAVPKGANAPTIYQSNTKTPGTGTGVSTEICFNPDTLDDIYAQCKKIPPYLGPPEVLLHELVHGLRIISGVVAMDNVPEEWHMDNSEEFCAILAANIFRSSRRFVGLRYLHHPQDEQDQCKGFASLPLELADSKAYYMKFKPHIVKWFSAQREFCVALAKIDANFNPMTYAAKELGAA